MYGDALFSKLHEDVILIVFTKLDDDPRHLARLACVCTKFSSLIRNVCWKKQCHNTIPTLIADLLSGDFIDSDSDLVPPAGGWASLHKLSVCCPGLLHAGVLLENSDFGLERELGPEERFRRAEPVRGGSDSASASASCSYSHEIANPEPMVTDNDCTWTLYDDLYNDTVYDTSEIHDPKMPSADEIGQGVIKLGRDIASGSSSGNGKKRKICRSMKSHIAPGVCRNLSREQGNKLLASRFRGDCLYICDWPGCVHVEEKRSVMLFRGIFKDFRGSRVWRTINDGNRRSVELECAYCSCKETYDLHSAFCLRRGLGYHDDGEPVVRAYVCENGHVSGAWTDWPLYT